VIVLTGFEPFGTFSTNPSGEVAKALDGRAFGAEVVRAVVLPVHHAEASRAVERLLDDGVPRAIVHLGLAGARARIALERVAVNVMDFEIADNAGYQATGEPCVAGGPVAYFSTLPLRAILHALVADGVPASAVLFLSLGGWETIPVGIFAFYIAGSANEAAALGVILIAVAAVSAIAINRVAGTRMGGMFG
jgi:pyroglutamyl-peptidase I